MNNGGPIQKKKTLRFKIVVKGKGKVDWMKVDLKMPKQRANHYFPLFFTS